MVCTAILCDDKDSTLKMKMETSSLRLIFIIVSPVLDSEPVGSDSLLPLSLAAMQSS